MPLTAPNLRLKGIADTVEFHNSPEGIRPYLIEYKRGYPKQHEADKVQLCAQALCLEIMLKQDIAEGAIFYGKIKRRTTVRFDDDLRKLTLDTINSTRILLSQISIPSAKYEAKRCNTCSLFDECQPHTFTKKKKFC